MKPKFQETNERIDEIIKKFLQLHIPKQFSCPLISPEFQLISEKKNKKKKLNLNSNLKSIQVQFEFQMRSSKLYLFVLAHGFFKGFNFSRLKEGQEMI